MAREGEVLDVNLDNFQDGDDGLGNGSELFGKQSAENAPVKGDRVFKKAKRTIKLSPRKEDSDNGVALSPPVNGNKFAFTKNSRKSRNGDRSRGMPKKGNKNSPQISHNRSNIQDINICPIAILTIIVG